MKDTAFYLGIGFLFTHELDAVVNHEWRVIPLIRSLSEEVAAAVFVAAHVPIFAVLIALISNSNYRIRHYSRLGVSVFLIGHGALHLSFSAFPAYEFSGLLSHILIYGGSLSGAVYLLLAWKINSPLESNS